MDMWNWLSDCLKEGSLTLEEMQQVIDDDKAARNLWENWSRDSIDFIEYVRDEVKSFLSHQKKMRARENNHG